MVLCLARVPVWSWPIIASHVLWSRRPSRISVTAASPAPLSAGPLGPAERGSSSRSGSPSVCRRPTGPLGPAERGCSSTAAGLVVRPFVAARLGRWGRPSEAAAAGRKPVPLPIRSGRHGSNSCQPRHEGCLVLSTKQYACLQQDFNKANCLPRPLSMVLR